MGAENSVLEGCDWGDRLPSPNGVQWNITPVTKKDGMEAAVFQPRNSDKKDNNLLQTSAKTLKGLRHPNIVRYLGCGTSSDGFWLATEPVSPLLNIVNDVGITSYELMAGIWDILQAMDFLHSKLGVCHNNICPASIYISKDGSWKLGGMEHACKFLEATPEFLESTRAFRNEDSLTPEEKTGTVKLDMTSAHSRDMFALGALVDCLMDFVRDRNDTSIGELEKHLTPCVSSDPSSRPTTSTLINSSVFRSDFIEIVSFIKNVTVKTEEQKRKFFSTLLPKLRRLPEEVVARKLVLPLLSRFVLLDETAEREVVPSLLRPNKDGSSKSSVGLLSEHLYGVHVIPHLCNVFRVHDCHIRLVLLSHFQHYVHLFSREQLEDDIFLQILLGIRDTDDRLVAASLKALSDLVPLLGGDFVIGGSRKCFFFHGIPKPVSPQDIQNLSLSTPNVTSVLTSSRTTQQSPKKDPNYKPLLKDLAYGLKSSNHSSPPNPVTTSEEKERKMREREQRREEARIKREERRMKAKTKQAIVRADDTAHGDNDEKSMLTIEKVAALDLEEKKLTSVDDDKGFKDLVDSEKDDDGLIIQEGDNDLYQEEEVVEDEEDKPDWSDWEDADGNISDEIEEELKHMSQSENYNSNNKVSTSPSPYQKGDTLDRYPPPSSPLVVVDWPDVSAEDAKVIDTHSQSSHTSSGSKGPLSLGVIRKKNSSMTQAPVNDNDNNPVVESFNSVSSSSVGNKALKLKNSNSSSSSTSSSTASAQSNKLKSTSKSNPPKKKSNDLGLGYDIKSVEIKSKSASQMDDLFADMAPVISSSKVDPVKDLLEIVGNVESSSSSVASSKMSSSSRVTSSLEVSVEEEVVQQSTVKNSTLFAVDTTSQGDQEEAGWGDDDDGGWGADDF